MIRVWIDDVRKPPKGYTWLKSVNEAKEFIEKSTQIAEVADNSKILLIDLDHDAGDYADRGGDYIKLLDWIEEKGIGDQFYFHIHSMNPVGVQNMGAIIKKNNWAMM